MRLLNTKTGHFKLFDDPRSIRYAILSHVWAKEGDPSFHPFIAEQKFEEISSLLQKASGPDSNIMKDLHPKVQKACEIAREHGFEYIWIDAGCIDKSSSAEVSQAINSMFEWYRHSSMCYVYLHDVDVEDTATVRRPWAKFRTSRWFRRGWTLQELIAPHHVLFLSKNWTVIGSKTDLADLVERVTLIDRAVLKGDMSLEDVPVATRLSWASKRETTEVEDEAYCLLGIFGIHMAPMYGEKRNAFARLQEAILRETPDPTLLAWGEPVELSDNFLFTRPQLARPHVDPYERGGAYRSSESFLLALKPLDFEDAFHRQPIRPLYTGTLPPTNGNDSLNWHAVITSVAHAEFTPTAHGVRVRLPLLPIYRKTDGTEYFLAPLACSIQRKQKRRYLALLLRSPGGSPTTVASDKGLVFQVGGHFLRANGRRGPRTTGHSAAVQETTERYCRLVVLNDVEATATARRLQQRKPRDLYIPFRLPPSMHARFSNRPLRASLVQFPGKEHQLKVRLADWCNIVLKPRGYMIHADTPDANEGFLLKPIGGSLSAGSTYRIKIGICGRVSCYEQGWLCGEILGGDQEPTTPINDQCDTNHIARWTANNCLAFRDFELVPGEGSRTLRLTLSLSSDTPALSFSENRTYILEVEMQDRKGPHAGPPAQPRPIPSRASNPKRAHTLVPRSLSNSALRSNYLTSVEESMSREYSRSADNLDDEDPRASLDWNMGESIRPMTDPPVTSPRVSPSPLKRFFGNLVAKLGFKPPKTT